MLPTINGKSFLECDENDLEDILDNATYRENEYLDYKRDFSIDHFPKGKERDAAVTELRSDVCAFANADGGYLIYGINEDGAGTPKELCGVEIENKDKWELALGNRLQGIKPRIPTYKVAFHPLSNGKYVVVLQIAHDFFAPYIHLEDEKNYRIYKRVGNSKKTIEYAELKNMFMQSMVLEKEIEAFRVERIRFYAEKQALREDAQFLLLHIIPDTFRDSNYFHPVFALDANGAQFESIFFPYGSARRIPTVEGIRYEALYSKNVDARLNNNGVLEYYKEITEEHDSYIKEGVRMFGVEGTFQLLKTLIQRYIEKARIILNINRVIVCFSLIGLNGMCTEWGFGAVLSSYIDRNELLCNQILFENIKDNSQSEMDLKRFELDYYYCMGLQQNQRMRELTKEIYGV